MLFDAHNRLVGNPNDLVHKHDLLVAEVLRESASGPEAD